MIKKFLLLFILFVSFLSQKVLAINAQTPVRAMSRITNNNSHPQIVAEYRFDGCPIDLMGEIKDSSSNNYTHIVKNGFTTDGDTALINRSGVFHAQQHQYTQGDGLDNIFGTSNNEFTITTWLYPTTLGRDKTNHNTANTFFAKASDKKNDNIEIGINSNGTLHLYLDTQPKDKYADFGNAGDITINSWHFIGVSYKNGEVTVQIDDKTYTNNTTWSGATKIDRAVGSPVTIGASLHINNYFDGYIDEFKIFSNQLSSITMKQLRQRELNKMNWDNTKRDAVECHGASPLGCIMSAFMFQNRPTDINTLNLVNGEMVLAKEDISSDNINAVGFNKKDGYFWGYNYTKHNGTLTRIGMNSNGQWVAEDFLVDGLDGFKSYVGDIDNYGHIYLKEIGTNKRVVVIDLDPNSANYLKKIREFNLDFSLDTADWGFNPKDNMIYAVNNGSANKYLYKIDPSNGHKISQQNTMLTDRRGFGASFFDANGFYYVYDNYSGNIYRIDVANSPIAVLFARANKVSYNDGAMCTDAVFKFDFGDLPDNYPSTLESNGARHSLPVYGNPTVYLGAGVSGEDNAKPSTNANLDEQDDGVLFENSTLQDRTINAGSTFKLKVITHGVGYLSGWIDWNGDGDFDDEYEQIAENIDGSSSEITLNVTAPSSAIDRVTYARFRYSYQQDLEPTGSAIDGEVEDYKINIHGNLEPFSCSDKLYLSNRTESGTGSSDSGATWLHSFHAMTPIFTPIGDGFTSSDGGYNAIGYNVTDNFIYALYGNELLKIDKNAHIKNLGIIDGLPDTQLYAGEFDKDGYYYVSGNGGYDDKIYKIDILQKKVIQTLNLKYSTKGENEAVKFLDMAIDTTNQYFYAMTLKDSGDSSTNDKLVKIDKNTGVMSVIGDEYSDISSYISLIFTDKNEKVIAIANGGGMYELDPIEGNSYWINTTPELNYYSDGTNCSNADFILPPHIPRLSIGDVTKAEGNSGETNFEFKVSIDADLPIIPMGMPAIFFYKIIDGNGNDITPPHEPATQSDHDFRGGNGISINMNIFSDKRETIINVPVYGDTKVEKDEEFFVDIYFPEMFPKNFCMIDKSRGVGLILNDDIKFKIIRTNGNKEDDSLYTQIAGRDFDYSIISDTSENIDNMTLKIELIDNNSNQTLYEGYKYIENSSRVDITDKSDLAILKATKDASFKISFLKDENGTIAHGNYANIDNYNALLNQGYTQTSQNEVGDHFAIRPAGYKVEIKDIDENNKTVSYRDSSYSEDKPLNIVAGYNYRVYAKAVAYDTNNSTAIGYSNDIDTVLKFNDSPNCNDTDSVNIKSYSFINGELQDFISHENVGRYILQMRDTTWSDIDKDSNGCIQGSSIISANGNEKSGCDIATDSMNKYHEIEMKFYPYSFALNSKVQNIPNSSKNFVYMNDLSQSLDMALDIHTDIVAQSKNGKPLSNFTYSCVADDIVLSLDYYITTDRVNNQPTYDKILTTKGSEVTFKRVVTYNGTTPNISSASVSHLDDNITLGADRFLNINEGNSSIDILYNLTKNLSEPINPVEIKFDNLNANITTSVAKINNKIVKANGTGGLNSTKKLYFSSIAPDRENYPDEYDRYTVTPISALIFCDHNTTWCTDMIGDNGLNNQKTKIGWFTSILHDSNKDGKVLGFTVNNLLGVVNPTADRLPNFDEDRAGKISKLTTGYSGNTFPAKVQVDMDLSPWLKYHRDPTRNGVPFWRNTFRDKNATWSGFGATGKELDIKATSIEAKKISW
ncbi:MAG: LamG domain-containing protein [Epsilonproteobacteria bacterium]|nr:LamG domain-containing protein [Campylobacterota bacterium]